MSADAAIFFDLDGTLVQFTRPYEEVIADTFERHLGEAGDDLVTAYDEAFYEAFHDFVPDPYHRGMAAALETAGVDADVDPDALVDTLREEEYGMTAVDAAVGDSLARLGEDAALGVLTNGLAEWQAGKLERHGLLDHFDAVITSYEAGGHKPDPEPFELATERVPATEYALVGDEDADVAGARAAGWIPIRYEDGDEGLDFWETAGALL